MTFFSNKQSLRNYMLEKRNNFLPSNTILNKLLQRFEQLIMPNLKSTNIAIYYPNGSELNILPFIKLLSSESFRYSLPSIDDSGNINFYSWGMGEELFASKFYRKILEPKNSELVIPDIIIAPLIACDLQGHRIGSGKGMYDKYINKLISAGKRPLCIGICYDFQLLDSVPFQSHDQTLDFILTDKRFINNSSLE